MGRTLTIWTGATGSCWDSSPRPCLCTKSFRADEFLRYMAAVKGLKLSRKELDHAVDRLLDTVNLREEGKRKLGSFPAVCASVWASPRLC